MLIVWSVLAGITVCGLCAGILALDVIHKKQAGVYRSELSAAMRQSVDELSGSLSALELKLQKGLYASTDYQTVTWAAQIFAEAGTARAALEALPIYSLQLSGTETFLNQAGEYVLEMARKQLRGETLTYEEEETVRRLALRAQELAGQVGEIALRVSSEDPGYDDLQLLLAPEAEEGADPSGFPALELLFSEDLPLNYDGVHSSWRENRTSSFLSAQVLWDKSGQQKKAADSLGVSADLLLEGSHVLTPFGMMEYRNGEDTAAVTDAGGWLCTLDRFREVNDRQIGLEEALEYGLTALSKWGYSDLEPVSWSVAGNLLTAVYVHRENGVLIYGESVTASVALDNGEVLAMDATEYLLSRRGDRKMSPEKTREQAQSVLREDLTVENADLVCLCGGDGAEKLCWQFQVKDDSETKVLVFVNALTGTEEEIRILLESEEFRKAV